MRASGIMLPIFSLPSKYGIGTLGKEAYQFIDFLKEANQKYWQILPMGNTTYGDSPYQSLSNFAGGIYYIDLDLLVEDKLLKKSDLEPLIKEVDFVDYGYLFNTRTKILKLAFSNFTKNIPNDFFTFIEEHKYWLDDFSLYMSLKKHFNDASFLDWPKDFLYKNALVLDEFIKYHQEDIMFYKFTQYKFFEQFKKLKLYANASNIRIIGDLPIYVSSDSADVFGKPELFLLNENKTPKKVAGVPPDYFSKTGQLWGNPIYNYQEMKKDNYDWFVKRLKHATIMYDCIRLDHFRGYASYYSVDANQIDAVNGVWEKGPGIDLFNQIFKEIPNIFLILEDLGLITNDVVELKKELNLPCMKIIQFGFGGDDSDHLPHNYEKNMVVYPGTHDNDTIKSWFNLLDSNTKKYCLDYLNIKDEKDIVFSIIKTLYASVADLVIVSFSDFLELDEVGRINTPGKQSNNWIFRIKEEDLNSTLALKINNLTQTYKR